MRPLMADRDNVAYFWSRVDQSAGPDACWPWTACKRPNGYGAVSWQGRDGGAHRVAFLLSGGILTDEKPMVPTYRRCSATSTSCARYPVHTTLRFTLGTT